MAWCRDNGGYRLVGSALSKLSCIFLKPVLNIEHFFCENKDVAFLRNEVPPLCFFFSSTLRILFNLLLVMLLLLSTLYVREPEYPDSAGWFHILGFVA